MKVPVLKPLQLVLLEYEIRQSKMRRLPGYSLKSCSLYNYRKLYPLSLPFKINAECVKIYINTQSPELGTNFSRSSFRCMESIHF